MTFSLNPTLGALGETSGMFSAPTDRIIIAAFEVEFAHLHAQARELIEGTGNALLYCNSDAATSVGENVLRGAAVIEQTFGGITANLWDDPFEWTLPETLSTTDRIIEYLAEVEKTRLQAFNSFAADSDLLKEIVLPSGLATPLIAVLTNTLARAAEFQGRALALSGQFADSKRPQVVA